MKEKRLSMLLLVALTLATNDVLAAAPESASAKLGGAATRTGWLGNTFRGGDRNKGRWVQLDIDDIFVFPDGRVVTDTGWDEGGRSTRTKMSSGRWTTIRR